MAIPSNRGWDFVREGETYQFKEGIFKAEVKVLEDNSTEVEYRFKLQTLKANLLPPTLDGIFDISHAKNFNEAYGGMMKLNKLPVYNYEVHWEKGD